MKQKGFAPVVILLLIALGVIFAPIPSIIKEDALCQPCPPNTKPSQCPGCPKKGDIEWRPSIFKRVVSRLSTFKFIDNNAESTLEATVMRSPTCAGAQSPGEICEAPYANGTFKIIRLPDNEVVQTVTTDKNGALTVSLASGTYTLQNIETGIGKRISNSNFTITSGETTIQRFDVDTGIR